LLQNNEAIDITLNVILCSSVFLHVTTKKSKSHLFLPVVHEGREQQKCFHCKPAQRCDFSLCFSSVIGILPQTVVQAQEATVRPAPGKKKNTKKPHQTTTPNHTIWLQVRKDELLLESVFQ